MTPDEALAIVESKARGRTRYEGQEAFLDEVLAMEIYRLRDLLDARPIADECIKMLDSGWVIQLFRNEQGNYTAAAIPAAIADKLDTMGDMGGIPLYSEDEEEYDPDDDDDEDDIPPPHENWITEDKTPSKVLYRLTEKAILGRV